MNEEKFIELLDETDRELDSFPFWASFKRACAAHSIKDIDKLTPGRQAILILWEASSQTKDDKGRIINVKLEGEMMPEKLDQLKADLIGHFMNEDLDNHALDRFFKSITKKIKGLDN